MSVATATPTILYTDNTQKFEIVTGTLAVGASPLTYATGGITCSFANLDAIKASAAPVSVRVWSQPAASSPNTSEYKYTFLPGTTMANGVLQVFLSAGFTPAGTNSAPTVTTTTNAGTTTPVYTNGGALTQVAGATGITGVQAPTFTGTAVAAAGLAELAAGAVPAGVSGDTIYFEAKFLRV